MFTSFYIAQQKSECQLITKIITLIHLQSARSSSTDCPQPHFFSPVELMEKLSNMWGAHSAIGHGNVAFPRLLGTGPSSQKKGKGGISSVHCNPHNRGAMLVFWAKGISSERGCMSVCQSHACDTECVQPPPNCFLTLSCLYSFISV